MPALTPPACPFSTTEPASPTPTPTPRLHNHQQPPASTGPQAAQGPRPHPAGLPDPLAARLDLPCHDHIPAELADAWRTWVKDRSPTELTSDGTKIGGWPYCVQSEVEWWTDGRLVEDCQYLLQLGSEPKAGLSWGFEGLGYVARQPGRGTDGWHLTWQSL